MSVPIITLSTDFGLSDPYVGVMKGVIVSIVSHAKIIDLTHGIPPQDIVSGALALEESTAYFPPRTIHVAVVDPGVGSSRAPLLLETERSFYVGPDNGLFSLVLKKERLVRAVKLENARLRLPVVSSTFHGRDIFAPAAAHLACGVPLEEFGPPAGPLTELAMPQPEPDGARLRVHVLRSDRFGNLITDLTVAQHAAWNQTGAALTFELVGSRFALSNTFADVPRLAPVAYFGSAGRLEIAIREGSAAAHFNAVRGTVIVAEQMNP